MEKLQKRKTTCINALNKILVSQEGLCFMEFVSCLVSGLGVLREEQNIRDKLQK
jgi:hypothetical protein